MTEQTDRTISRRDFHKRAGQIATATALSALVVPHVHAAENNTINLALIGCGGRGTGAVVNALKTSVGPTKLTYMVDVFEERLDKSLKELSGIKELQSQIEVPEDRRIVSFEGYKQAMDGLKKGDVAILTTPPAFRWVQFTYAIQKGLNVFMEKPVTVDGPTTRRMYKLAEEASAANLKVGVGLMCRHCRARGELFKRIKDGEIGDIVLLRAYRQHGPVAECFVPANPGKMTDTMYQIRNFHAFLWASGGLYSDFYIHNIDECCWMMDKSKDEHVWPSLAQGSGGRNYRGKDVDQNFDSYNVEYTFDEGTKLYLHGRTIAGAENRFASYAHGTKGSAVISTYSHFPAKCRIFKGQDVTSKSPTWKVPDDEPDPYRLEWDHLIAAIRDDKP